MSWNSRLKVDVATHFNAREAMYVKNRLLRIDIKPVYSPDVVDYAFKALKNGNGRDCRSAAGWQGSRDRPDMVAFSRRLKILKASCLLYSSVTQIKYPQSEKGRTSQRFAVSGTSLLNSSHSPCSAQTFCDRSRINAKVTRVVRPGSRLRS
jgi:hypothetical protein